MTPKNTCRSKHPVLFAALVALAMLLQGCGRGAAPLLAGGGPVPGGRFGPGAGNPPGATPRPVTGPVGARLDAGLGAANNPAAAPTSPAPAVQPGILSGQPQPVLDPPPAASRGPLLLDGAGRAVDPNSAEGRASTRFMAADGTVFPRDPR